MGINNLRTFWKKRIKIRINTKKPVLEFTPSIPLNLGSKIRFFFAKSYTSFNPFKAYLSKTKR